MLEVYNDGSAKIKFTLGDSSLKLLVENEVVTDYNSSQLPEIDVIKGTIAPTIYLKGKSTILHISNSGKILNFLNKNKFVEALNEKILTSIRKQDEELDNKFQIAIKNAKEKGDKESQDRLIGYWERAKRGRGDVPENLKSVLSLQISDCVIQKKYIEILFPDYPEKLKEAGQTWSDSAEKEGNQAEIRWTLNERNQNHLLMTRILEFKNNRDNKEIDKEDKRQKSNGETYSDNLLDSVFDFNNSSFGSLDLEALRRLEGKITTKISLRTGNNWVRDVKTDVKMKALTDKKEKINVYGKITIFLTEEPVYQPSRGI